MNENSPEYGLDPVGFLLGGFITAAILYFGDHGFGGWVVRFPLLTALIGFPIAAMIYGEARKAYSAGYVAGLKAATRVEEP